MKHSAGLLVYRKKDDRIEVLIAHMGAPWWAKKDAGAWSIPKGVYEEDEDALAAAQREFKEELGLEPPPGKLIELGTIAQKNKKVVIAWAVEGNLDVSKSKSNTFEMEWPPHSGQKQQFPEIDRAAWFSLDEASKKLIAEQGPLLERLAAKLGMSYQSGSKPSGLSQNTLF